jgi:hypothetical protein
MENHIRREILDDRRPVDVNDIRLNVTSQPPIARSLRFADADDRVALLRSEVGDASSNKTRYASNQ